VVVIVRHPGPLDGGLPGLGLHVHVDLPLAAFLFLQVSLDLPLCSFFRIHHSVQGFLLLSLIAHVVLLDAGCVVSLKERGGSNTLLQ